MKNLLLKFLILNVFASSVFANTHIFGINITHDKKLHIGASFMVATSTDMLYTSIYTYNHNGKLPSKFKRFSISFLTSMTLGLLKEIHDKNKHNNHFDNKDLKADFLGALTGSLFSINIKW